ncbi:MAG: EsaB/YukD family protein [Oscillospiraceae bacterium]
MRDPFMMMDHEEIRAAYEVCLEELEQSGAITRQFEGAAIVRGDLRRLIEICAECDLYLTVDAVTCGQAEPSVVLYRQGSCWAQLTKDGELASLTGAADGEIEELALARLMECCKAQEAPEAQTHWSLTNEAAAALSEGHRRRPGRAVGSRNAGGRGGASACRSGTAVRLLLREHGPFADANAGKPLSCVRFRYAAPAGARRGGDGGLDRPQEHAGADPAHAACAGTGGRAAMKACQNVIVTLTIGDEQLDVELPAFLPVAEVNARVLEMLRALYPQVYGSCTAIRLYDQGAPIAESRTLASCGIWDGASLQGRAVLE